MAGFGRFFRTYKPRQFHYEPIYYNERKEKLDKIVKQAELDSKMSSEQRSVHEGILKGIYRDRKRVEKRSNILILFIILFFLGAIYYILTR